MIQVRPFNLTPDLLHGQQLHIKNQIRVARDHRRISPVAIAKLRRNPELALAAHLHAGHALVPALDYLPCADRELEGLAAVQRAVKLRCPLPAASRCSAPSPCCPGSASLPLPTFKSQYFSPSGSVTPGPSTAAGCAGACALAQIAVLNSSRQDDDDLPHRFLLFLSYRIAPTVSCAACSSCRL